jgi:hypothetical protein
MLLIGQILADQHDRERWERYFEPCFCPPPPPLLAHQHFWEKYGTVVIFDPM